MTQYVQGLSAVAALQRGCRLLRFDLDQTVSMTLTSFTWHGDDIVTNQSSREALKECLRARWEVL